MSNKDIKISDLLQQARQQHKKLLADAVWLLSDPHDIRRNGTIEQIKESSKRYYNCKADIQHCEELIATLEVAIIEGKEER